jgi:gliding motility-associated transport system ATP-binding protein
MGVLSMTEAMIEAEGLTKHYGSFVAIRDVSLSISAGQVVAFLGPNGAGKSTTLKILTGYLAPTEGRARIAGLDVTSQRIAAAERIGYLPENGPLYLDMTARETLAFLGRARGMERQRFATRLSAVAETCALTQVLDKPARKLSHGYRQRIGMACALLHEPDVLILDEPTSGLDPNQIKQVRETLRSIGESKTILLSTHILQEVEAVADRVIMIAEGRIVFDGTPAEFREAGDDDMDKAFYQLTGVRS